MKRLMLPLTVFLFAVTGQAAWAQQLGSPPTTPFSRPAFSPYLNLARPGASSGINYFGLVRPQVQAQNDVQQLQQQAITTQTFLDNSALTKQPIVDTGSGARFMNYNRYFMTVNRSGGGTGGTLSYSQPLGAFQPGVR